MKLTLFWDYVSSFRALFGALCTLRWPKNVWTKTPPVFLKHIWLLCKAATGLKFFSYKFKDEIPPIFQDNPQQQILHHPSQPHADLDIKKGSDKFSS